MGPPVISWFRNPSKYPYFCTTNHSENGLLWPTNRNDSWPHGGPTLSVARPNRWVIESSRRCRWDSWGAHPRTEPCGGAARRIWETRWGKLGTFHKPPTPTQLLSHPHIPHPNSTFFLQPQRSDDGWELLTIVTCGPAAAPTSQHVAPVLAKDDQSCKIREDEWIRMYHYRGSGNSQRMGRTWPQQCSACWGLPFTSIYRNMAISWTINRDLIRSHVDATIYKSKIRWLYLLVIC